LEAKVVLTHYGHEFSVGHVRLSFQERKATAGELLQGVSFNHILDKIRDSIGPNIHRTHLLVKKDLLNIEKSFSISKSTRHSSDVVSVHLWVKQMEEKENCPILFYKQQGESLADIGVHQSLSKDDFTLVIQTPIQAEVLQLCGKNKVVCIDSTHGTNGYDFKLISLVVVDEFGEGIPVAWCFSNREDKTLLINFFRHLKQRMGDVRPKWLMSDDADQFYSAWITVFNKPQKLLCTWHVDRSWRKAISSMIKNETDH